MSVALGIDCGIRTTKAVAVDDAGRMVGRAVVPTDWNPAGSSVAASRLALEEAGVAAGDVQVVAATGCGRDEVEQATCSVSDIKAACVGARAVDPQARQVIDLGAESIMACRIEPDGGTGNFAVNDKCASGAGAFLESMARIIEVPVEDLSDLSRRHTRELSMDSQCVVFAESEVISLVHRKVAPADIVYAVHAGLAGKISSIVLRLGATPPVVMIGAASGDDHLVEILGQRLGCEVQVPEEREFVSAWGAALHARRTSSGEA